MFLMVNANLLFLKHGVSVLNDKALKKKKKKIKDEILSSFVVEIIINPLDRNSDINFHCGHAQIDDANTSKILNIRD